MPMPMPKPTDLLVLPEAEAGEEEEEEGEAEEGHDLGAWAESNPAAIARQAATQPVERL